MQLQWNDTGLGVVMFEMSYKPNSFPISLHFVRRKNASQDPAAHTF